MEDNDFDKIMFKYVLSTGNDAEHDLAKLRNIQQHKRKKHYRHVWSFVAVTLVVGIVLSIVLPLTMTDKNPQTNSPLYCDANQVDYIEGSLDEFEYKYDINLIAPNVSPFVENKHFVLMLKTEQIPIGIYSEYSLYDEFVDVIKIFSINNKFLYMPTKSIDDVCVDVIPWQNLVVRYNLLWNDDLQNTTCRFVFEKESISYYVEVAIYGDITIADILAYIYQ